MTNELWLSRLKKIECPDSTYAAKNPSLVLSRAKGSFLFDVEGQEYIDLSAGFGALPLGHNDPEVLSELSKELKKEPATLMHGLGDVYPSQQKIELMEAVLGVFPKSLDLTMALTVTGSQAVEFAMKTALIAGKGDGFITFKGAYHGLEFGSLAVSDREIFRRPFVSWLNEEKVFQLPYGCPKASFHEVLDLATKKGVKLAAVILEPVQGRAGVVLPPQGFLKELESFCQEKGLLLILDEVLTGLGRLGQWSFCEEITPDLVCLGKAIGGGMPLSGCVGKKKVMAFWPESRGEAIHTGTYFGHPHSCLVGRLTLEAVIRNNLLERVSQLGEKLIAIMNDRWSAEPLVKEVRGRGFMMAIEFSEPGAGAKMADLLRKERVIVIPGGEKGQCLSLTPALNMSEALFEKVWQKIDLCLKKL